MLRLMRKPSNHLKLFKSWALARSFSAMRGNGLTLLKTRDSQSGAGPPLFFERHNLRWQHTYPLLRMRTELSYVRLHVGLLGESLL